MTEDNGVTITKDGHVFTFRMAGELLDPEFQNVIADSEMIEIPTSTEENVALEENATSATENTIPWEESVVVSEETVEVSDTDEAEAATEAGQEASEDVPMESDEEQTEAAQEKVVQQEQETEAADENLAVVSAPAESVAAEIELIDMEAVKVEAEYPETVVEKTNSRLSYEEIYEDTDIIFDLKSNQVKESIVMKEYREALKGYVYALEVGDMIPVLKETGEIELRSADGEEVIMYMPAPYLIDDAGATCFDINVSLAGESGKYILAYPNPKKRK